VPDSAVVLVERPSGASGTLIPASLETCWKCGVSRSVASAPKSWISRSDHLRDDD